MSTLLRCAGLMAALACSQALAFNTFTVRQMPAPLLDITNSGLMLSCSNGYATNCVVRNDKWFYESGYVSTPLPTWLQASGTYYQPKYYGLGEQGQTLGFATQLQDNGGSIGFIEQGGVVQSFALSPTKSTLVAGMSPNGNYVVGYTMDPSLGAYATGFLLDRRSGVVTELLPAGSNYSRAFAVTDSGQVSLATYETNGFSASNVRGFVYGGGAFRQITVPGMSQPWILGLNESGYFVGQAYDPVVDAYRGFIMQGQDVQKFEVGSTVTAINESGTAVGRYFDNYGYIFTAVPEPGSAALLAAGCVLLGGFSRRRKLQMKPGEPRAHR